MGNKASIVHRPIHRRAPVIVKEIINMKPQCIYYRSKTGNTGRGKRNRGARVKKDFKALSTDEFPIDSPEPEKYKDNEDIKNKTCKIDKLKNLDSSTQISKSELKKCKTKRRYSSSLLVIAENCTSTPKNVQKNCVLVSDSKK